MSAKEKNPALYFDKTPYDGQKEKKKCSSKSIIGWIFISLLFLLLILLLIQIFYSPFYPEIRFWSEKPIDIRTIPPRFKTGTSSQEHKVNPADPWNVEFLIDPSHLCDRKKLSDSDQYTDDSEVELLMLVPSAVDHFEQRKAVRNTWGSVAEKPFGPKRLAFALGTTTNHTVDDLIQEESSKYRDIIQADFADSYQQLTTKSIAMLKWVAKRCSHAQYFLKADDDTFVNLGNIARILSYEPYVTADKFISGFVQTGWQPEEDYYITVEDYTFEEYPPYASGATYVMTVPTAIELFQASKEVKPLLSKEDIFLTGLCAKHIAAPLIHEPSFEIKDPPNPPSWETFSPLAAVHSVTPDILELVWKEMTLSNFDSFRMIESALNDTLLLRIKKSL